MASNPRQRGSAIPAWTVWLCMVVGVLLFLTSAVYGWRSLRLVIFGQPAVGTVVDFAGLGSITATYPVFEFADASGVQHRETSAVSSSTRAAFSRSIGDRLPIRFDPRQPNRVQENTFRGLWAGPVVIAAIGLAAIASGMLLKKMRGQL